jgi:hypothetical protein
MNNDIKSLSGEDYINKWFKEPYKSQLLKNIDEEQLKGLYINFGSLFNWSKSPEGHDYWAYINDDIQKGKTDTYMTTKTFTSVKDFLNSLNEPYRIQALSYTKHVHDKLVSSLLEAIDQIDWNLSKEGTDYWSKIYKDIYSNNLVEMYIKEEYLFYLQKKIN